MPTIKIKGSSTAAAEPLTLAERELAVNVTDKKLYVGDGAAVQKIVGSLGNQEASAVAITGGSIAGITDLAVADGGTGASTAADARTNLGITATGADTTYAFRSNNLSDLASASTARTNLGLGSIATQASSSVSITGGSITGVTDIAIADGGTGASTAADARTNLGLGSIATQSASSVSITGGTISGITDLAVADGGTGASTAADARTNLSVPSTTGSGASGTWDISITGNAATATSATSATTATNLAGGAANRVPYQSASGTTTFVAAPTVTNSYLKWNGTALGWDTVSGGGGGGGSGDVVGPASATDSQIALFDGTTGKLIKAATTTGLLKASSGVIAAAVSGTDYAPATSGSANQLLASNGTGGFTNLTTGTGVVTALGVNTGSSGAFVVNGGALGTPLSGTVTNLTGTASININGTVGATTANTGAFTTLSATGNVSFDGGTFVFNESGADKDFRIEGDTDANLFFTDASTDRVGIGTSSPAYKLDVQDSNANIAQFTSSGASTSLRINNTNANAWGSNIGIFTGGTAAGYFGTIGSLLGNTTQDLAVYATANNGFRVYTNGNNLRATFDSSGNLGLGVTPSAWGSFSSIFQGQGYALAGFSSGSNVQSALFCNAFFSGSNYIYRTSAAASQYLQISGQHQWFTAPSGTAGNAITFTQAMTLFSSGGLAIGATNDPGNGIISIQGTGGAGVNVRGATSNASFIWFTEASVADRYLIGCPAGSGDLVFRSNAYNFSTGTERARITSGGDFFIGNGETAASPSAGILSATGGTGTNIAGANLTIRGGASTGTGAGGVIIFSTAAASGTSGTATNSASERARITSGGYFKASNNGTYINSTAAYHELVQNADARIAYCRNSSATLTGDNGFRIEFSAAAPNNTTVNFLACADSAAIRTYIYSNGGLANYSANNVNLSDRREKTNFAPAKSYLDTICAIPVQTFNYIDQSEDDPGLTLGVVAQDVQAVAPELVMESNWGTEENPKMRLSIYQTDLQYALMKCIQEQQALITSLTARVAALEGTQP